ncbi:GNAT family N-acetyltransferase [Spirosoma sp. 209]|uniref:GNAT family N-acetyltransferase n=1 Tax=Spirosoma sp. 209 TaxID=1955701 RepID=UPI00098D6B2C|nr:GNAT family protein [Spirosoma sp. 209]
MCFYAAYQRQNVPSQKDSKARKTTIQTTTRFTAMISLQPFSRDSIPFAIALENHPENRRFVGQWAHAQYDNAVADPDYGCFIVLTEGTPIGHCILSGLKSPDKAILLKRLVIQAKGQGYGRATLARLMELVFDGYKANRLWLDVRAFNIRAEALYQSMGFCHEGTLRQGTHVDEAYYDLKLYGLLREEYEQQQRLPAGH